MHRIIRNIRVVAWIACALIAASISVFPQAAVDAPEKKPIAVKFAEIGTAGSSKFLEVFGRFMIELSSKPEHQGYIVNFGTDREIERREKLITDSINFRKYDRSRITLVRGGPSKKPATILWVIPPGADNPPI